ncbi:MAG: hypothetical protein ACI9EW_000485 [Cellvibrionaceae bacterium]
MYAREIEGEEYSFGVSGKLIRNVLVMYDRQTNSFWSQLLGEAVEGEKKGTKLEFVPSWFTTWEQWKEIHPDSLALNKGYAGARDPYERGYYDSPAAGVIGETIQDDRLYTKEFVVGVEFNSNAVAYPFSVLNDEPVVNDTISDAEILVLFDKDSASAVVYDRVVKGQTLTFSVGNDPFTVIDNETGSTWDSISGEALSGELAGSILNRIKSTTVFWFGWKDFFPDTLLYGI